MQNQCWQRNIKNRARDWKVLLFHWLTWKSWGRQTRRWKNYTWLQRNEMKLSQLVSVEQIHKFDGFSDFHKPLGYDHDSLRKADTDWPVIITNISIRHKLEYSEAIIIHNQDDPIVVSLPDAIPVRIVKNCNHPKRSLDALVVWHNFRLPSKQYGPA